MDYERGYIEPQLWIADAFCGAIVADRLGEPKWLQLLGSRLQVIEVTG